MVNLHLPTEKKRVKMFDGKTITVKDYNQWK